MNPKQTLNDAFKASKEKINQMAKSDKLVWAKHAIMVLIPDLAAMTLVAIAIGFTPWLVACIILLLVAHAVRLYSHYKIAQQNNIDVTELDIDMNKFIKHCIAGLAIGAACLLAVIFLPAFGHIACWVAIAGTMAIAAIELAQAAVTIWQIWQLPKNLSPEEQQWLDEVAPAAN